MPVSNQHSKCRDDNLDIFVDDVFKPQDIDLDNNDLDEFEIQLEMFKRYIGYFYLLIANRCFFSKVLLLQLEPSVL